MKTALVVDDDPLIRHLLRRMLELGTCRVVEAADGAEALRLIETGTPPLDVLLTDLNMPGVTGFDVVEAVTRYRPDLPVVVVSSSAAQHRLELATRYGVATLSKPFTLEQVTGLVSSILAGARAPRAVSERMRRLAGQASPRSDGLRLENSDPRKRADLVTATHEAHSRRRLRDTDDVRRRR